MKEKGLLTEEGKARFKLELKEIDNQTEHGYFLELFKKKLRFPKNENNLLIAYSLGLCDDLKLHEPPNYVFGDFPDVDTDFLGSVRDYLKKDWAPKVFGKENVCPIGNYGTFGVRSSLIDAARIFDLPDKEIKAITTSLETKDDEGKTLSFDKAVELFPDLKAWCEKNPEAAEFAKHLQNRNRGLGKHAGGLIVSSQPIFNLVPLIKSKEENEVVSAFVEGLHGTDLGPLGLIKFDLLVVKDLERIMNATALVKKRHNLPSFYALPGQGDWTDTSYLEDEKALEMANRADLRGIFQFDSDGIRKMVKEGGVSSFDDIAAYSALYRPGPLGMEMDKVYIRRKKGKEQYNLHPLLDSILGVTYGVMCFQEQVMRILNVVGGIPLIHCEKVRKAISKKKTAEFAPYKITFIQNGMKNLGQTEEQLNDLWNQIASFAEYGFNKSHSYSYGYISQRLLVLKSRYPLEFFAATLASEGDADKIKEYKLEAERHGVKVKPVDINRSGWNFQIKDEAIYMGFSNVKGIGESAAREIVKNQPYASFEDFLARFGTQGTVLKPLIGLGLFKDADRAALYEFAEYYKDQVGKRSSRDQRAEKSRLKIVEEFRALLDEGHRDKWEQIMKDVLTYPDKKAFLKFCADVVKREIESAEAGEQPGLTLPYTDAPEVWKLASKYKKNVEGLEEKKSGDGEIKLADFKPTGEIPSELKKVYEDIPTVAEGLYYGFGWDHVLEYSPDYQGGMTFSRFEDESKVVLPVEVQIVKPIEERISKVKKNKYYSMRVEDANWHQANVNVWQEDYERFKEEFGQFSPSRKGNLLRIRLERPSGGFPTYTFESPPKHRRHKEIPADKAQDHRMVLLRGPWGDEPKEETNE
jgi:DNA polymerase III alpha subunit